MSLDGLEKSGLMLQLSLYMRKRDTRMQAPNVFYVTVMLPEERLARQMLVNW